MSQDNPPSPGPVHALVGQLRKLLADANPGRWETSREWSGVRHYTQRGVGFSVYREIIGTGPDGELIAAAINALPSLLAIAEAADAILICGDLHWHTPQADRQMREDDLRTALSLLPNAGISGQPSSAAPLHDLVGCEQPKEKP